MHYLCTNENPPSLFTMLKSAGRFIFLGNLGTVLNDPLLLRIDELLLYIWKQVFVIVYSIILCKGISFIS